VATIDGEFVLKHITTFSTKLITRVSHPAVSLHEHSRTKVFILVPPVRWARGRAASTQDTFVQSIELLTVFNCLQVLLAISRRSSLLLEERFNALVLLVKVGQIWDEILYDMHVGKRINLGRLAGVSINSAQASQSVATFNVHGARTADTFTA
jgi:hypothetical protein